MNILGGLDRPSAGKAIVDGQDLLKLSNFALTRYRRQRSALCGNSPRATSSYLSVEENVELPMIVAGMPYSERKAWTRSYSRPSACGTGDTTAWRNCRAASGSARPSA